MPWKECSVMGERLRSVARLLEGEPMTDVCRSFGISRKTGNKLFARYKEDGPVAPAAAILAQDGQNADLCSAAPRQPARHEVVTDVLGTNCQPCVRTGQPANGAPGRIRTCDLCLRRAALYPAELRVLVLGRRFMGRQ